MTVIDNPLLRTIFIINILAVALGIVGNVAPGVGAKVAGYALFGVVVTSPGLVIFSLWQTRKRLTQLPRRQARVTQLLVPVKLIAGAVVFAIVAIFLVALLGKVIGEPGSGEYPETATRVVTICLIGLPFVAAGLFMLWLSVGPRKHYYRGVVRLAAGDAAAALDFFEVDQQRRPEDPRAWEGAAASLLALGRGEEALADADRALAVRMRWQGLLVRGTILSWLGAFDEALEDLERCTTMTRSPAVKMCIGAILVERRLLEEAIAILVAALKGQTWIGTSLMLAEAYRLRGLETEARIAYKETIDLAERTFHPAKLGVSAYALVQLGRLDEASAAIGPALENQGYSDSVALHAQALASVRTGDLATTERSLRELMGRSPQLTVQAMMDPDFTPLLSDERFKSLLGEALNERQQVLGRVLSRSE